MLLTPQLHLQDMETALRDLGIGHHAYHARGADATLLYACATAYIQHSAAPSLGAALDKFVKAFVQHVEDCDRCTVPLHEALR